MQVTPVKPLDGASTIALVILFSFAIERIVTGLLFCLAWFGWFDPAGEKGEEPEDRDKRHRLRTASAIYFALAAAGAGGILWAFQLTGILTILGLKAENHWLDSVLTVLVLACGADRLADTMKTHGMGRPAAAKAPDPTLVVTGTLHFDESSIQLRAKDRQS